MRVAVVGGNLQGVEASYLARKAGWEVLLLDRDADVPASGLCSRFVQVDVTRDADAARLLEGVDWILPALENAEALAALEEWSRTARVPLAFDPAAYALSSSKLESNRLFERLGLPAPRPWPECRLPVVVKPDGGSGSRGVRIVSTLGQLHAVLEQTGEQATPVVEEYLTGPSFSIEVTGEPGHYVPLQVTDLHMDAGCDCKRVSAPSVLSRELVAEFERMAVAVAEALRLKGVMDLEVILHDGRLKILEIDARLPSQTPTVVYWSTGINMVELLGGLFAPGMPVSAMNSAEPRSVLYEHVRVTEESMEIAGEHIMSGAGPLRLARGFFGADEAITSHREGASDWVATLIFSGPSPEEVLVRRWRTLERIRKSARLDEIVDTCPSF